MKKLQFAMVGGGNGALIGDIHRIGAQFDDLAELKAGCFSRHWDKNLEAGEKWGVEPGRIYPDYHTMLEEEAKRTGEDQPGVGGAEGPGPGKRSSVRRVLQLCPLRHSGAGQKDDR